MSNSADLKPLKPSLKKYPVAVKHSCKSVWCPQCYKRKSAPRQSGRMSVMDWKRTRMITLTLNPDHWVDGEDAYIWFRIHKPIGRFMQDLKRAGITVTDWTCNMEWHDNGFPHWHLLIEVSRPGSVGMIGQELLHKLWAWGDLTHRVHETYFRDEQHFKNFCGYFCKTGYLHKDKSHQVILPGWASGKGFAGIRINRFSSKRRPNRGLGSSEPKPEPVKRYVTKKTYAYKHGLCGQLTELWEVECAYYDGDPEPVITRTRLRSYRVPFNTVVQHLDGIFYQGAGYSLDISLGLAMHILDGWEVSPPFVLSDGNRKAYQEALPLNMIHVDRKHDIEKATSIAYEKRLAEAKAKPLSPLGKQMLAMGLQPFEWMV